MDSLVVLIHSPLVGPFTWSLIAEHLRTSGIEVLVPVLTDWEEDALPYWQQHAESVKRALASIPETRSLVLVGHSGAGPLLPAISQVVRQPVAAYIFVDAGLPHPGKSRLDEMQENVPELAQQLRQHLVSGGRFPDWSDEDLRKIIPDERLRQGLVAELHPRSLAFFEETMPIIPGWPDAPCGYLLMSEAYQRQAEQAQIERWVVRRFDAGHFHMLVDPVAVTTNLLELMNESTLRSETLK